MALENNQLDGQTDIARFLEKFNQDVSSADHSFAARSDRRDERKNAASSKQEAYQQTFEKLEEKIRELEDKFEASAAVSQAIMRELERNRAATEENRKSKDAFIANISVTIANLKESVEKLSRTQQTPRVYAPAPAPGRAFDAAPTVQTSAEEYLAMTHYRPESYRVAQQAKLHAERAEKEKALYELKAQQEENRRVSADLQAARSEKERAQFDLDLARGEKEKALSDLRSARREKEAALNDLDAMRDEKEQAVKALKDARNEREHALSDLYVARGEKETAFTELNAAREEKQKALADLQQTREEKEEALSQLHGEREEKARIISSLQQKASQLKAVNVALDREIKRAQEEKMEALRKSAEQAKEILSLRDALTAAEERFKSFDFDGRIISIKQHYQQKVSTLENQLHEISNTCMKQVEEIEALKNENLKLHKLAEEREQLAALYEAKTRELEELQASVAQLRAEGNTQNQARVAAFTHRMQRLQKEHEELSQRLTQAQEALSSVSAEKKTLENNFKALLAKIEQNDAVIENLKRKIAVLTEENRELKKNRQSGKPAQPAPSAVREPVTVRQPLPKQPNNAQKPALKAAAEPQPPEPETAPVEMQNTLHSKLHTEADLPEIRVAQRAPQEDLYNGEDFLEKTDSFIGRMKWSIFREDK